MVRLVVATVLAVVLARQYALAQQIRADFPGKTQVRLGEYGENLEAEVKERADACQKQIAIARGFADQKKWLQERQALDSAQSMAVNESLAKEIASLYDQLQAEGDRQFKEAKTTYDQGKYAEALKTFESISQVFGALPAGVDARKAIEGAKHDPTAQAALQEQQAAALAGQIDALMLNRGVASQPSSQPASGPSRVALIKGLDIPSQSRAVGLLEKITEKYGASATGQQAAADLKALEADQAFIAPLSSYRHAEEAKAAINKAETFEKAGLRDKAVEYYRQVVRNHPDTAEAAKARVKLAVLEPQK